MSAFPESGHSNRAYFTILNGCFRPEGDIQEALISDRITNMGWYRDTLYPKLTNYLGAGLDDMRREFL
ncbi:MAG: hypothetical protein V3R51_03140, partial [Gammaproteobacteria bacterium]